MHRRRRTLTQIGCIKNDRLDLGSEQALAPVREPDTFEGEAELQKKPNITPVCAANIHRQKNGGLERT